MLGLYHLHSTQNYSGATHVTLRQDGIRFLKGQPISCETTAFFFFFFFNVSPLRGGICGDGEVAVDQALEPEVV